MLIRSSLAVLERKRVPVGPLRVNRDNSLSQGLSALFVWNAQNATRDLVGNNPNLTVTGSAVLRTGIEGMGLDCSGSTTSGAYRYFGNTDVMAVSTGAGQSIYCRAQTTATAPDQYASLFGLEWQSALDPYVILAIGRRNDETSSFYYWNSAGTFVEPSSNAGHASVFANNEPRSHVLSHAFGVSVNGYERGRLVSSTTSSVSAPNYATSNNVLAVGYNTTSARNSQMVAYICGVWNRPLSAIEAQLLEAEPYSLVEQSPLFLSMLAAAAPPPSTIFNPLRGPLSQGGYVA